ncbi:MAG: CooT family nickel-binding protein [Desulfobacterales bacterium]
MCLSTVFLNTGQSKKVVMKDVARIEAEGSGFWLISLFGEKTFVEGAVKTIDFTDEHLLELESAPAK